MGTVHEAEAHREHLKPRQIIRRLYPTLDAVVQCAGLILRQIFRKHPAIAFSGCNEKKPANTFGGSLPIEPIWIGNIDVLRHDRQVERRGIS
jgi:hypothetical protein